MVRRSGFDPTRRNRNIGTAGHGHGSDNRMVVPLPHRGRRQVIEAVNDPNFVEIEVAGEVRTFVVERTRADTAHPCTPDDVVRVLSYVPANDIYGLDIVVFRQPTRKQERLSPVWGRLSYFMEVGKTGGAALILEAGSTSPGVERFGRNLSLDARAELERFRQAGLPVVEHRRRFDVQLDFAGLRMTQLYRTVLHEVGHYVDYLQKVERPSEADPSKTWFELWDRYWQRPQRERETFAHRYAETHGGRLTDAGRLPFDRLDDPERLRELGLRVDDFHPSEPGHEPSA